MSKWQAVGTMEFSEARWAGALYSARFVQRPVGTFAPNRLVVAPIAGSARVLRCPWGRPRRKRDEHLGPNSGRGGVGGDSDGGDSDDSDEDSDDDDDSEAFADDLDAEAEDGELPLGGGGDAALDNLGVDSVGVADPSLEPGATEAEDEVGGVANIIGEIAGAPEVGDGGPPGPEAPAPAANPPPPAAPAAVVPRPPAATAPCEVPFRFVLQTEGGSITWYCYSDVFVASGRHHGASCRKHRTSHPSDRRLAQGRPLGWMLAWLDSYADHGSAASHRQFVPSLEARIAARARLHGLDDAGPLMDRERLVREDEGPEPEANP